MAHVQTETVPLQRRGDERELSQGRHARPPEVHDPGGRVDIVPTVIEKAATCAVREVAGVTTPGTARPVSASAVRPSSYDCGSASAIPNRSARPRHGCASASVTVSSI